MSEIELAEYFNEHWYHIKDFDKWIASVTTKLDVESKPFLAKWRGDIGNKEADRVLYEAGERGKRIHYALQIYLASGTVIFNPPRNPKFSDENIKELKSQGILFELHNQDEMIDLWKLQRFFDIVKPKVLHSELKVYSIEKDIAGTLDIALEIEAGKYMVSGSQPLVIPKTGIYIADLKTGKTVSDSMWRQIAPYAYCFEEMKMGKPEGGLIIHTGATTKGGIPGLSVKLSTREELAPYLNDYYLLANIWKRNNPNAGPELFKFPTLIKKEN